MGSFCHFLGFPLIAFLLISLIQIFLSINKVEPTNNIKEIGVLMVRYFIAIVRFYSTLTNLAVQVINVCNYREYSNELCIRNNIFVGRNPRGFDNLREKNR